MKREAVRETAKKLALKNYTYIIERTVDFDGNAAYLARVSEFQGCFGYGKTTEEALSDVKLALVDMIEVLLETGEPIPEENKIIDLETEQINNLSAMNPGIVSSTDTGLANTDRSLEMSVV